MTATRKKFNVTQFLHVASTTFVVLFFIKLAEFNEGTVFNGIFYGFAILDVILSFLYVLDNSFVSTAHLFFHSVLFVIPICTSMFSFIFYYYPAQVEKELSFDVYHYEKIRHLNRLNLAIWSTMALIVWMIRMTIAYLLMIDKTSISFRGKNNGDPLADNELRNVLNLCSFVLFTTLSYFHDDRLQTCFTVLAIVEIVMAFSYILASSFVMKVHYLYQSTVFSFVTALMVVTIAHESHPAHTIVFLTSYGMHGVAGFVARRPIFAVSVLFFMWLLRLTDLAITLIEVDTRKRIRESEKLQSAVLISTARKGQKNAQK